MLTKSNQSSVQNLKEFHQLDQKGSDSGGQQGHHHRTASTFWWPHLSGERVATCSLHIQLELEAILGIVYCLDLFNNLNIFEFMWWMLVQPIWWQGEHFQMTLQPCRWDGWSVVGLATHHGHLAAFLWVKVTSQCPRAKLPAFWDRHQFVDSRYASTQGFHLHLCRLIFCRPGSFMMAKFLDNKKDEQLDWHGNEKFQNPED